MNKSLEFVTNMATEQRLACIAQYIQFEKDGSIGECELRTAGRDFAASLGAEGNVVLWMEQVANACFRYYAVKYLEVVVTGVYEGEL